MGSAAARTTRAGSVPDRKVDRATDDDGQRIGVGPSSPSVEVLRPADDGYNCFVWAVGSTSFILTYAMVEPSGSSSTLDKWTTYLATHYGFARSADGLDPNPDLILYGDSPTQVLHAARRADEPYGELTFSSKIGGGVDATPVILHAPADIQSNLYGHALRSFRRVPTGTNTSLDDH